MLQTNKRVLDRSLTCQCYGTKVRRTQILAMLLALLALCPLSTVRGAQPVRTADPGVNTATSDLTVVQQAYLKAAVSADGYFGQAVALSGDTAVVSAPAEGGLTGAVYVFIRSNAPNAIWQRQAVIRAPNPDGGDYDQLRGDAGNDVLLDGDGVAAITGGGGNDLLTVVLRNGWRDSADQPRFTGLAAGYDNDLVTLILRNAVRFWVALSGDEADEPPSPLEGSQDFLTLISAIDATSEINKFEKRLLIAADADYLPPDEEAGAAYLSEPVGANPADVTQLNRAFFPLINR